jgi:hypothetical protein
MPRPLAILFLFFLILIAVVVPNARAASRRRPASPRATVSVDGDTTADDDNEDNHDASPTQPPTPPSTSFLLTNATSPDVAWVQKILAKLHEQQHPPKETCRHRRLLVTQFEKVFEGLGSIMKIVLLQLAEAAHANRTLVWGLDLPYLFEHSRTEWFTSSSMAPGKPRRAVKVIVPPSPPATR